MNESTTEHGHYCYLENGIHQFDIFDASRQAVDEFFALRGQLQEEVTEDIVLLLIRLQMPHLPSISHIVNHTKQLSQRFPHIQPTYSAIIYRRGMLVFVLNNFLKVFLRSKDRVRFFAEEEADKATEWLLRRDQA